MNFPDPEADFSIAPNDSFVFIVRLIQLASVDGYIQMIRDKHPKASKFNEKEHKDLNIVQDKLVTSIREWSHYNPEPIRLLLNQHRQFRVAKDLGIQLRTN